MQHIKLANISTLGTTAASVVANPSGQKTFVKQFILHNYGTVSVEVSLFNPPSSSGSLGTAALANRFFNMILEPSDTVKFALEMPIILSDTNDAIFGSAATASSVNIQIQGARE